MRGEREKRRVLASEMEEGRNEEGDEPEGELEDESMETAQNTTLLWASDLWQLWKGQ